VTSHHCTNLLYPAHICISYYLHTQPTFSYNRCDLLYVCPLACVHFAGKFWISLAMHARNDAKLDFHPEWRLLICLIQAAATLQPALQSAAPAPGACWLQRALSTDHVCCYTKHQSGDGCKLHLDPKAFMMLAYPTAVRNGTYTESRAASNVKNRNWSPYCCCHLLMCCLLHLAQHSSKLFPLLLSPSVSAELHSRRSSRQASAVKARQPPLGK
jgi:hypothetical protein